MIEQVQEWGGIPALCDDTPSLTVVCRASPERRNDHGQPHTSLNTHHAVVVELHKQLSLLIPSHALSGTKSCALVLLFHSTMLEDENGELGVRTMCENFFSFFSLWPCDRFAFSRSRPNIKFGVGNALLQILVKPNPNAICLLKGFLCPLCFLLFQLCGWI